MTSALQRSGMTLIEVLAVVVILGLLAVTLTIGLAPKMGKAKHEIAKTQIAQIVSQIEAYKLEKHQVPSSGEGLTVLTTDPNSTWFLDPQKLTDPWGNAYQYLVPGPNGRPFEILSYGADNQPGGDGDNADLSSTKLGG
jgi:general secretion pathway protein G